MKIPIFSFLASVLLVSGDTRLDRPKGAVASTALTSSGDSMVAGLLASTQAPVPLSELSQYLGPVAKYLTPLDMKQVWSLPFGPEWQQEMEQFVPMLNALDDESQRSIFTQLIFELPKQATDSPEVYLSKLRWLLENGVDPFSKGPTNKRDLLKASSEEFAQIPVDALTVAFNQGQEYVVRLILKHTGIGIRVEDVHAAFLGEQLDLVLKLHKEGVIDLASLGDPDVLEESLWASLRRSWGIPTAPEPLEMKRIFSSLPFGPEWQQEMEQFIPMFNALYGDSQKSIFTQLIFELPEQATESPEEYLLKLKWLLENGVDPLLKGSATVGNLLTASPEELDRMSADALMAAFNKGLESVVRLFLEHTGVGIRIEDVHAAFLGGQLRLVTKLHKEGVINLDSLDETQDLHTILSFARDAQAPMSLSELSQYQGPVAEHLTPIDMKQAFWSSFSPEWQQKMKQFVPMLNALYGDTRKTLFAQLVFNLDGQDVNSSEEYTRKLEWLLKNGVDPFLQGPAAEKDLFTASAEELPYIPADALTVAFNKGLEDVVRLFLEHTGVGIRLEDMQAAYRGGQLPLVKKLHEEGVIKLDSLGTSDEARFLRDLALTGSGKAPSADMYTTDTLAGLDAGAEQWKDVTFQKDLQAAIDVDNPENLRGVLASAYKADAQPGDIRYSFEQIHEIIETVIAADKPRLLIDLNEQGLKALVETTRLSKRKGRGGEEIASRRKDLYYLDNGLVYLQYHGKDGFSGILVRVEEANIKESLLIRVAKAGAVKTVRALVEKYPSRLGKVSDISGYTALDSAWLNGHTEVAAYLAGFPEEYDASHYSPQAKWWGKVYSVLKAAAWAAEAVGDAAQTMRDAVVDHPAEIAASVATPLAIGAGVKVMQERQRRSRIKVAIVTAVNGVFADYGQAGVDFTVKTLLESKAPATQHGAVLHWPCPEWTEAVRDDFKDKWQAGFGKDNFTLIEMNGQHVYQLKLTRLTVTDNGKTAALQDGWFDKTAFEKEWFTTRNNVMTAIQACFEVREGVTVEFAQPQDNNDWRTLTVTNPSQAMRERLACVPNLVLESITTGAADGGDSQLKLTFPKTQFADIAAATQALRALHNALSILRKWTNLQDKLTALASRPALQVAQREAVRTALVDYPTVRDATTATAFCAAWLALTVEGQQACKAVIIRMTEDVQEAIDTWRIQEQPWITLQGKLTALADRPALQAAQHEAVQSALADYLTVRDATAAAEFCAAWLALTAEDQQACSAVITNVTEEVQEAVDAWEEQQQTVVEIVKTLREGLDGLDVAIYNLLKTHIGALFPEGFQLDMDVANLKIILRPKSIEALNELQQALQALPARIQTIKSIETTVDELKAIGKDLSEKVIAAIQAALQAEDVDTGLQNVVTKLKNNKANAANTLRREIGGYLVKLRQKVGEQIAEDLADDTGGVGDLKLGAYLQAQLNAKLAPVGFNLEMTPAECAASVTAVELINLKKLYDELKDINDHWADHVSDMSTQQWGEWLETEVWLPYQVYNKIAHRRARAEVDEEIESLLSIHVSPGEALTLEGLQRMPGEAVIQLKTRLNEIPIANLLQQEIGRYLVELKQRVDKQIAEDLADDTGGVGDLKLGAYLQAQLNAKLAPVGFNLEMTPAECAASVTEGTLITLKGLCDELKDTNGHWAEYQSAMSAQQWGEWLETDVWLPYQAYCKTYHKEGRTEVDEEIEALLSIHVSPEKALTLDGLRLMPREAVIQLKTRLDGALKEKAAPAAGDGGDAVGLPPLHPESQVPIARESRERSNTMITVSTTGSGHSDPAAATSSSGSTGVSRSPTSHSPTGSHQSSDGSPQHVTVPAVAGSGEGGPGGSAVDTQSERWEFDANNMWKYDKVGLIKGYEGNLPAFMLGIQAALQEVFTYLHKLERLLVQPSGAGKSEEARLQAALHAALQNSLEFCSGLREARRIRHELTHCYAKWTLSQLMRLARVVSCGREEVETVYGNVSRITVAELAARVYKRNESLHTVLATFQVGDATLGRGHKADQRELIFKQSSMRGALHAVRQYVNKYPTKPVRPDTKWQLHTGQVTHALMVLGELFRDAGKDRQALCGYLKTHNATAEDIKILTGRDAHSLRNVLAHNPKQFEFDAEGALKHTGVFDNAAFAALIAKIAACAKRIELDPTAPAFVPSGGAAYSVSVLHMDVHHEEESAACAAIWGGSR